MLEADRENGSSGGVLSQLVLALAGAITLEDAGCAFLREIGRSRGLSYGAIWIEEGQTLRCVSTWQAEGERFRDFDDAVRKTSLPRGRGLPGRVWQRGEAQWAHASDATWNDAVAKWSLSGDRLPILPDGIRAVFVTPLVGRTGLLGVMAFLSRADIQPGPLVYLSEHVGPLLERCLTEEALRRSEARYRAQMLAQSSLGRFRRRPGIDTAALYQPASRPDGVGGDIYDYIPLDEGRLAIVVGDVSGKGLTAAVYSGMVKYTVRALAFLGEEPGKMVRRLNEALYRQMSEAAMFVSLVYVVVDVPNDRVTWVNAGHPPPVLYDAKARRASRLDPTGGVLAASLQFEYDQGTLQFRPGAVMSLFTDGVSEAGDRADPYSDGGVGSILARLSEQSAERCSRAIFDHVRELAHGRLRDDVAIVVVRRTAVA